MLNIDTPNINNAVTPEQNIQTIKGWAEYLVGELNFQLQELENQITALQSELSAMKEENQ